jgi:hypothetical protein
MISGCYLLDVNEWSEGDERHGRYSRKGSGGAQRALPTYKSAPKTCIRYGLPLKAARKNTSRSLKTLTTPTADFGIHQSPLVSV